MKKSTDDVKHGAELSDDINEVFNILTDKIDNEGWCKECAMKLMAGLCMMNFIYIWNDDKPFFGSEDMEEPLEDLLNFLLEQMHARALVYDGHPSIN